MSERPRHLTAQQRAAHALWLLMQEPRTTREIANECDLSRQGALDMLHKLTLVVPLCYDRYSWWIDEEKSKEFLSRT